MTRAARGLAGLLWVAGLAWAPALAADLTVVLVRHAEKAEGDPHDPGLSGAGQARALALAQALAASPPHAIYATQLRRTTQTALPTRDASGAPLSVRPAREPATRLAAHIVQTHPQGTVLVVGHSNTIPDIVEALTGIAVPPMDEQEYDRVHVAILSPGTTARLVTFRYGAPNGLHVAKRGMDEGGSGRRSRHGEDAWPAPGDDRHGRAASGMPTGIPVLLPGVTGTQGAAAGGR